jgi:O-succinylbenzoate synthase
MGLGEEEGQALTIESVELREIQLPLVEYFETSLGRTYTRRIILLCVMTRDAVGYGECTAEEEPLYNGETTDTAWHILSDFAIPHLIGKELDHPSEVDKILSPIRENRMAKATLETALWDLEARRRKVSLVKLLGGTRKHIACGVSIGIQATVQDLMNKVTKEVEAGYRRVKIKIKPGWEVEPIRQIQREFPDLPLMADANSAFGLADMPLFRELDRYGLMMIEQPLAHDDIVDHAILQKEIETPICLDESIRTAEDTRKAVEMGSCRIINVKLGRVGGFSEALKIHDYCAQHEIPLWCGGMLESGVGRAHNIALSSLPGFTLPGDVSASKRYFSVDTIDPPVTVSSEGTIHIPTKQGIGFDLNWPCIRASTVRTRRFGREDGGVGDER